MRNNVKKYLGSKRQSKRHKKGKLLVIQLKVLPLRNPLQRDFDQIQVLFMTNYGAYGAGKVKKKNEKCQNAPIFSKGCMEKVQAAHHTSSR